MSEQAGMPGEPLYEYTVQFTQVVEYGHEQAVADEVNVPFDVYRIRTLVTEQGSTIDAGIVTQFRDRQTRRTRWEKLDEDLAYTASQLDRAVVARDQIRTVLETCSATACSPRSSPAAARCRRRSSSLRAYPGWVRASRAAWAFLKAIRPLASWSSARWFSGFFDQRISSARLRFSQEWQASTTQRRARQPGLRSLSLISSPRVRMWAVYPRSATSSRTGA